MNISEIQNIIELWKAGIKLDKSKAMEAYAFLEHFEYGKEEAYISEYKAILLEILNDSVPYDANRIVKNIQILLQEHPSIRIGRIEEEAGISRGGFSRVYGKYIKGEQPGHLPVSFLCRIGQECGVSLDELVYVDFASRTEKDQYMSSVLGKILTDTKERTLQWNSMNRLASVKREQIEELIPESVRNINQLYDIENIYIAQMPVHSKQNSKETIDVIFITHTLKASFQKVEVKKVYSLFLDTEPVEEICNSLMASSQVSILCQKLAEGIADQLSGIKLSSKSKSILDAYLFGQVDSDEEGFTMPVQE